MNDIDIVGFDDTDNTHPCLKVYLEDHENSAVFLNTEFISENNSLCYLISNFLNSEFKDEMIEHGLQISGTNTTLDVFLDVMTYIQKCSDNKKEYIPPVGVIKWKIHDNPFCDKEWFNRFICHSNDKEKCKQIYDYIKPRCIFAHYLGAEQLYIKYAICMTSCLWRFHNDRVVQNYISNGDLLLQ